MKPSLRADLDNFRQAVNTLRRKSITGTQRSAAKQLEKSYISIAAVLERAEISGFQIRFSGPPGPKGPRLIGVEDLSGFSMNHGEWVKGKRREWLMRFTK